MSTSTLQPRADVESWVIDGGPPTADAPLPVPEYPLPTVIDDPMPTGPDWSETEEDESGEENGETGNGE